MRSQQTKLNNMKEQIKPELIPGKSTNRVHSAYKIGTEDWEAEYNMLLMDGVTCKSCQRCNHCVRLFGSKDTDTSCQWHPNRFIEVKGVNTNG